MAFEQEDEEYSGLMGSGSKRKKSSKNNTRTDKSFYIKFIFCILVVEAYFVYNYAMTRVENKGVKILADKYNITTTVEPYFWQTINTQREMLYNKSRQILSKNAFQMASESPYLMYQMTNELEQSYLADTQYLDDDYLNQFHNVMTGDLCPDLIGETGYFGNNVTTCRNFTYGISE